ncbi:hypothetical protein TanjilG_10987 [Lupinus angustifolius]|uniref:Uncharacterized protein n=1 Tax=Lupinus angustifolius TaxID=3871 RepID=A0A1J7GAS0_LUPAN|nr:PREDICTED: cation/H(+) antiporter 4-like [Lupinus angustifolius]OIV97463.1 hypothetical protein TanjilG_10987 [Lupinus angustifolius]
MNVPRNATLFFSVIKVNESTNLVCFEAPPHIVSDGIFGGKTNGRTPMKSFLPMFEMQMLLIFVLTQICHFILKPLGLPQFIPQMTAGLILGSLGTTEISKSMMTVLFPYGTHGVISSISSFGYVLFIFTNGVQMDFSLITRTGRKAWAIAVIGIAVPLIAGHPFLYFLNHYMDTGFGGAYKDMYISLVSSTVTMFAVTATLLNELQIQNSELGRLALSSALAMDIISTTLTTAGSVIAKYSDNYLIWKNLLSLFAMAVLVPLVCRPLMVLVIKHTPEGRPVKNAFIYIIVAMVLLLGWLSVYINQDFVLGAFILGLSVPEGPPLGSALVKKLHFFGSWFLLPIFVTTSVMRVDLVMEYSHGVIIAITSIILFTHIVKIVACFVPAVYCNLPTKDALSLALILNCKGVVEIGVYCSLYDSKVISAQTYGILMVFVMIIASIVQVSVKVLYDPSRKYAGYQRRNIMGLKSYSELNIVACIHKPHHISPISDALDLCCPTTENPIIVDVIHLVELVGRTLPLFIPHGFQRQGSIGFQKSYSDDVILAFDVYEHENEGAAKVHTYTAISPSNLMYEDVCHLALDKVASLIILPFHQRWSSDGSVETDDKNIRALNNKVLEISPCSVGILVTRANNTRIKRSSCVRLAMIFLGGKDDREALCLAKRAIRNIRIHLVVYHVVLNVKEQMQKDGENIHDNAALRDIDMGMKNVTYQEIKTNDGPETASFLGDIVNEHDYFIVGRRHGINSPQTEGLSDWSEFPELGSIGDYLASPDFKTNASILVVQQQVSKLLKSTKTDGWLL